MYEASKESREERIAVLKGLAAILRDKAELRPEDPYHHDDEVAVLNLKVIEALEPLFRPLRDADESHRETLARIRSLAKAKGENL